MKMNLENIALKKLNKNDLTTLIQWASNEGWNPGKNDLEVFWNTDPDGFYGFYYDDKLIAGGAIISYNKEFGFMGLFIVHKDFRSKGIGKKLWHLRRDLLINRLHDYASIGMDGVLDMQSFYSKGGFNIAFRDERYEFNSKTIPFSNNVSLINQEDFEKITAYDNFYFGFQRAVFLKNWLQMPESKAIKYTENNKILGYAVIRKAETGYKIGPLFADNTIIAEELFKSCLSMDSNDSVFLDIPTTNQNAVNLVKKYHGKYVFECARMYYGATPKIEINNVYGITTFELG
jgi:ribosomal protein S18 acetylase RimI-like enzyme